MLKSNVNKFIESNNLLKKTDLVLVAISGGADSVALLRILLSLGYACECMHCNFHLRDNESDRDEQFVKELCYTLSVPLHITHFDTTGYAKEKHLSIEMAARELRYQWFEQIRMERNASAIAVAHHRNDSVETVLLNLIRGTGINGLTGIAAKNGWIIRPLLNVSREEILAYLQAIHQNYVTDSTNLQDEYMRNKIRLNLIPLMKQMNPSIIESLADTATRLSEVAAIYNKNREKAVKNKLVKLSEHLFCISIQSILDDEAPISLLHEILFPLKFNHSQVQDIYHCLSSAQSGKRFYAPDWEVLRDRKELYIQKRILNVPQPELEITSIKMHSSFVVPRDKTIACIDAEKVKHPLIIRKWKKGDTFIPLGMNGKKKISDYLTDKKYSLFQKENQYVVCSGEDIVWLVNERIDQRFRITENSQNIWLVQLKNSDSSSY